MSQLPAGRLTDSGCTNITNISLWNASKKEDNSQENQKSVQKPCVFLIPYEAEFLLHI